MRSLSQTIWHKLQSRFALIIWCTWLTARLCHYSDNDRCGSSGRWNCSVTMRRGTASPWRQAASSYLVQGGGRRADIQVNSTFAFLIFASRCTVQIIPASLLASRIEIEESSETRGFLFWRRVLTVNPPRLKFHSLIQTGIKRDYCFSSAFKNLEISNCYRCWRRMRIIMNIQLVYSILSYNILYGANA